MGSTIDSAALCSKLRYAVDCKVAGSLRDPVTPAMIAVACKVFPSPCQPTATTRVGWDRIQESITQLYPDLERGQVPKHNTAWD